MTALQKAILLRENFQSLWQGSVPADIHTLFEKIIQKAEQDDILDLDLRLKYGYGLLHCVVKCQEMQAAVIDLLLENGININQVDDFGNNALHTTISQISYHAKEFVNYLLLKGIDVNCKNHKKITPLYLASTPALLDHFGRSSLGLIPILLEQGAKIAISADNVDENLYEELLDYAEEYQENLTYKKALEILEPYYEKEKQVALDKFLDFKAEFDISWYQYTLESLLEIIKENAQDYGVFSVDALHKLGFSLLHLCAIYDRHDEIKVLLKYGANIDIQCKHNLAHNFHIRKLSTPLHCLLDNNVYDTSAKLFKYNDLTERKRMTMLYLLEKGARTDIPNCDGMTLDTAAEMNPDVAEVFLEIKTKSLELETKTSKIKDSALSYFFNANSDENPEKPIEKVPSLDL